MKKYYLNTHWRLEGIKRFLLGDFTHQHFWPFKPYNWMLDSSQLKINDKDGWKKLQRDTIKWDLWFWWSELATNNWAKYFH